MEYKLNKIDIDVRQSINSETREGKIHSKKGISVNKDKNRDNKDGQSKEFKLPQSTKNGKYIVIEAEKKNDIKIDATIEDKEFKKVTSTGVFIDERK